MWSDSTSKIPALSQAVRGFAKSPRVAARVKWQGREADRETACSGHGILPLHKVPYIILNLKGREVFWQAAGSKCMPVPKGF